jgi:3-hydroxyisobutyrate dehydrogenase-like beta-hydroxyacid dehydrogenase
MRLAVMETTIVPYRIGLIGLGTMGGEIAQHLAKHGWLEAVYDINPERRSKFRELAVETIDAIVGVCHIFIFCLPNPHAVKATIDALLETDLQSAVFLDLSTSSPKTTQEVYLKCQNRGVQYLEAPMTGGVRAARTAKLRVIVGGDKAVYERLLPIFDAFTKEAIYIGRIGTASTMKLVHNLVTLGNALVTMEALLLGEHLGLDVDMMFEVFQKGTASSYVIRNTLKRTLIKHDFQEGFKLYLAAKDMQLAENLASSSGVHLHILERVTQVFQEAAKDEELALIDYPIVCRTLAQLVGISNSRRVMP